MGRAEQTDKRTKREQNEAREDGDMTKLYCFLLSWFRSEDGAETVEYALVVGLFAIAAVVALLVAGDGIRALFNSIGTALSGHAAQIS
jgi:pilus assembly protein Flp/PilA